MKYRLIVVIYLFTFLLFNCKQNQIKTENAYIRIEQFFKQDTLKTGDTIMIEGIYSNRFECVAIFASLKDYMSKNDSKALWIEHSNLKLNKELEGMDMKHDYLCGILNLRAKGHLNQFAGTVNILYICE